MQKFFSVTMVMATLSWCISFAQGGMSPDPQVFQSLYNDTSQPLRDMEEAPLSPTPWENGMIPLFSIEPQFADQYQRDKSLQEIVSPGDGGFILQSWDGVPASGFAPPDASGDVGPNHYMEMVNVRFQIWNKLGTSLLGPLNLGTIWSGFPGPWSGSLNDGDPIVLYDETAGRWFAAQFSLPNFPSGPFYMLIAVSQTGDPTGSWHRYGFTFTNMPDYEKFGVWPDAYYMSANSFSSGSLNFIGASATAFDRTQMLAGNPATMVFFQNSAATTWSLLPSDWNGTTTPPAGSPNYFGQQHDNADYGGNDGFDIFQFHVDWVTPGNSTFTGPTFLATNPFVKVNGIPQLGSGTLLDDLDQMTMFRLDYRNFGAHQSMVTCQTIDAGSSRAGVRWYEFRNTGSGWTVYQQGTYAPADGLERWMGSIAINENGDIGLGYSVSNATIFPEIRYTGRLSGDALGLMTIPEETIQVGLGAQSGLSRWGDYTHMTVDPDGETFWYVNQYQPSTGSFNWRTRIASINFSSGPCPIGAPTNPSPVSGTIDLPLTGNILSWTNGAGTTMNEVYWNGNPVPVYDGPAITSFSLAGYEPLTYSTNYTWRVVCKDATCGTSGPTWDFTTLEDPNLANLFCDDFTSGLGNWTITNDGGVCVWDIHQASEYTLPPTAVGNVMSADADACNGTVGNAQTTATHTGINATQYQTVWLEFDNDWQAIDADDWAYVDVSVDGGTTWQNVLTFNVTDVRNTHEVWDLTSLVALSTFSIRFKTIQPGWDWWWAVDNICIYATDIIPVELTSFAAVVAGGNVELNWSTATETNNQGFQIERSNGGEFNSVGFVAGHGTTTETQVYTYTDKIVNVGSYSYRLKQVDFDGTFEYSDVAEVEVGAPVEFALDQNYPNPFNPSTKISFRLAADSKVSLKVFDVLGQEVMTLINNDLAAGSHQVDFDASSLNSGVYFYKIEATGNNGTNFNDVKKMVLTK